MADGKSGTSQIAPRHSAGADPAKRDQILTGAKQIFFEQGFDAAGVNDICRAAGVSKSTLYVYFGSKEDLFEAIVEQERHRLFSAVSGILLTEGSVADVLRRYACEVVGIVCSDRVVQAHRIIIGIAERMPDLGARFYDSGPMRAQTDLAAFFRREIGAGRLAIPDVALAAAQFIELATATLWRPRLFARMTEEPTEERVRDVVDCAVSVFLAAYGVKEGGTASGTTGLSVT